MLKGFKEFLLRGNVIDLAVAVVVGAAFSAIVTAFTGSIIHPLINSLGGTDQAQGLGFQIRSGNPATFVDFGTLITAALNFVIIAAVVYFIIVMPFEKLKALRAKAGDDAAALSEAELLTEIRDLLAGKDPKEAKQKAADASQTTAFAAGSVSGPSESHSTAAPTSPRAPPSRRATARDRDRDHRISRRSNTPGRASHNIPVRVSRSTARPRRATRDRIRAVSTDRSTASRLRRASPAAITAPVTTRRRPDTVPTAPADTSSNRSQPEIAPMGCTDSVGAPHRRLPTPRPVSFRRSAFPIDLRSALETPRD